MGIPVIGDIINAVKDLAGEVIVDKDKRNEIEFKIKELEDANNDRLHQELLGQIEVNKIEAAHSSLFVAGWRPFIGWTSGAGLAWTFVVSPFVEVISRFFGYAGDMPVLDTGQLMTLVLGMLGLAGYRTYEKKQGVHRSSMKEE